jgi:hypothetical protein
MTKVQLLISNEEQINCFSWLNLEKFSGPNVPLFGHFGLVEDLPRTVQAHLGACACLGRHKGGHYPTQILPFTRLARHCIHQSLRTDVYIAGWTDRAEADHDPFWRDWDKNHPLPE